MTGSLNNPEVLIVGWCRGKELEVVGRTVKLKPAQAAAVAALLKPAGVRHPWPDQLSTHWGQGKTAIVKFRPRVVVEVVADSALQARHYRHPLRFVRQRTDLTPADVETPVPITPIGHPKSSVN